MRAIEMRFVEVEQVLEVRMSWGVRIRSEGGLVLLFE